MTEKAPARGFSRSQVPRTATSDVPPITGNMGGLCSTSHPPICAVMGGILVNGRGWVRSRSLVNHALC
jgi:hypothetical protein